MKICSSCGIEQQKQNFSPSRYGKEGLSGWCKKCHTKTTYVWRKNNPEKVRSSRLRHKFGLDIDSYNQMLEKQNGCCAICLKPETMVRKGKVVALSVDHNRACCPTEKSCGKCIRGLLCYACNTGIARFNDDVSTLKKAIKYINNSLKGDK